MKTIVRLDPFTEMRRVNNLFEDLFAQSANEARTANHTFPIEVSEREGVLTVKANAAGIKPSAIKVKLEEGVLTIHGEYQGDAVEEGTKVYRREINYGTFTRSIRVPEDIDTESTEASFDHGILTVTLKRKPAPEKQVFDVPVRLVTEAPSEN